VSRKVGRYELVQQVGRGGLGVVWKALDPRSGAVVAVKLITRAVDEEAGETVAARRLAREYKALSSLEHPNVVRALDAGVHEGNPFLVMEFVDGLSLRAWLDVRAPLSRPARASRDLDAEKTDPARTDPPDDDDPTLSFERPAPRVEPSWLTGADEPDSLPAVRRPAAKYGTRPTPRPVDAAHDLNRPERQRRLGDAARQLTRGLGFIHSHGLVHRDVKPSNVLVADGGVAKLVDFGLVKVLKSGGNTTAAGHVVGTWRYMSPEQARGDAVDGRSDLYSLGSVLYELLTGEAPFTHKQPAALLNALVYERPVPVLSRNPLAEPALVAVAMRLIEKRPDDRFPDAAAVLRALE